MEELQLAPLRGSGDSSENRQSPIVKLESAGGEKSE